MFGQTNRLTPHSPEGWANNERGEMWMGRESYESHGFLLVPVGGFNSWALHLIHLSKLILSCCATGDTHGSNKESSVACW